MPAFDVYFQLPLLALGATRQVLVPYPANPVQATNTDAAVIDAAEALAAEFGGEAVSGTYVVYGGGTATQVSVVSFESTPVLG